jgi:hypothetical protein
VRQRSGGGAEDHGPAGGERVAGGERHGPNVGAVAEHHLELASAPIAGSTCTTPRLSPSSAWAAPNTGAIVSAARSARFAKRGGGDRGGGERIQSAPRTTTRAAASSWSAASATRASATVSLVRGPTRAGSLAI